MKNVAFLVRVYLAVSEKEPETKTTLNYLVLQNVQPSDDITPLTQEAYYHLLLLVGYNHRKEKRSLKTPNLIINKTKDIVSN